MANDCKIDNDSPEIKSTTISFDTNFSKANQRPKSKVKLLCLKLSSTLPFISELKQYLGVIVCGILLWGSSWFLLKDDVLPGGYLFEMSALIVSGYIFGHTLERYTSINSVVGMTLVGVLWRYFSTTNFLKNPTADSLDFHLRKIYPVIILTKGPLTWNWQYIKSNYIKVFSLATLPWIVECLSTAVFTHLLLGFPWHWGVHLGAILSSVSPAVIVPTTIALSSKGLGLKHQIALLVSNAGGLDTAFTEGMFGVINSAIFYPAEPVYRIVKALLATFVGIVLGVVWAIFLDYIPDHEDFYAPTVRSLLIFAGGLFITYVTTYLGWGGTSGVAIMVCAGAAATRWSKRGWPINNNPVSEVYKLLWRIFEPMLFSLSGYFLEVSQITAQEFGIIVACIISALLIRMLTAFLVALVNNLTFKESLFIAITWIPKAIVEAVLVRVALDSLWSEGTTPKDKWIATHHSKIIVIAIILTSTLGSVLTTTLGPILLSRDTQVAPADKQTLTVEDKGIYFVHHQNAETSTESVPTISLDKLSDEDEFHKNKSWYTKYIPTISHYITLVIIGALTWGILFCVWGEKWGLNGEWFRLALLGVIAWASGQILQELTTLPPMLAALLTGIIARHLGFVDMRRHVHIDSFLRKIYPVIILGKGSLGWNVNFMRQNWKQIVTLGALPWCTEVTLVAISTHYLLGFPWIWGTFLYFIIV